MTPPEYVIDQMISAKSIAARVESLAHEISDYFKGTDQLIVVGLLRGSFVFIADLVREIDLPVDSDPYGATVYQTAADNLQSFEKILGSRNRELLPATGPIFGLRRTN